MTAIIPPRAARGEFRPRPFLAWHGGSSGESGASVQTRAVLLRRSAGAHGGPRPSGAGGGDTGQARVSNGGRGPYVPRRGGDSRPVRVRLDAGDRRPDP